MSGGGGGSAEEAGPRKNTFGEAAPQSVDLNLTALMDILSNLLFFLLASFGATIVMSINATVPVQSADQSDVADKKDSVTVNIKLTKDVLEVNPMGTAQTEAELLPFKKTFTNVGVVPDKAGLQAHLFKIRDAYPKSDTVLITPDVGVSYGLMINVMDAAREAPDKDGGRQLVKLFPTVVLSTVVK